MLEVGIIYLIPDDEPPHAISLVQISNVIAINSS